MAIRSGMVFILYAIHACAAKTTLSAELTNLIPTCAQSCFTSFLDFNFALTKCGINPTLDCLCTTGSASGYTVGEGAVQCVLSTASCSNGESQDAAAFKAYTMCDGRKGSLPNTHATLTATLVLASSTTSAATATSKSDLSASSAITASTTETSVLPSTFITTTSALLAPTTSTASMASTDAEAASQVPKTAPILSRNQAIGIGVGSFAGALVIIGCIILACLRRRKFQRSHDSDMLPFQMDPSNDLNYGHGFNSHMEKKINGPGGTPNGVTGKIVPKIPMRIDTQNPNMFSRRSLKSDMIGVAISPETKQQRRSSRLLPEKPSLTLTVPGDMKGGAGLTYPQRSIRPSAVSRQSTATQFEEDFDSADTAVAADDSWGQGLGGLQYPGGKMAVLPREQVPSVVPFSVTGGSDGTTWRPRKANTSTTTTAPGLDVKPLQVARVPIASFSQPRKPDEYPSRSQNQQPHQQRQPLQISVPNQTRPIERPITGGSSVYSTHDSLPASVSEPNNTRPPAMPRTRLSYKASGPYDKQSRHQSNGSQTSIETNGSAVASPQDAKPVQSQQISQFQSKNLNQKPILAPINTNPTNNADSRRTVMLDLSPVVESPPSGRSPVSYPKIPARGRLPENTIRMVPPPAQPNFSDVFHSGHYARNSKARTTNPDGVSPEARSPLVASPTPIESATGISPIAETKMKPWRVAEIHAQRERERIERERVESEPISAVEIEIGMITPPPQPVPVQLQPFRAGTGQIWPQQGVSNPYMGPPPPRIQPQHRRMPQPYLAPSVEFNKANSNKALPKPALQQQLSASYEAFDPSRHGPYQQRSSTAPPLPTQNQMQGGRTLTHTSSHPSFVPTRSSSASSNASSLLAKRRGEQKEKALALNLARPQQLQNGSSTSQKWRVLDKDGKEKAKSEAWRPKIGTVENGNGGYEVLLNSGGGNGGLGTGDLPKTPGWVPKLTPTRRGDELFLSVA